jgi:hypothetical protein
MLVTAAPVHASHRYTRLTKALDLELTFALTHGDCVRPEESLLLT